MLGKHRHQNLVPLLCFCLAREGGRQEPFVVFVTTEWTEEQRSTAQAAGANGFLPKPFTPEALHQLLSGIL